MEYAPPVSDVIGLARIGEIARQALTGSSDAIAAVTELAQRLSGIDVTVVSEIAEDGSYVFRGLESRPAIPLSRDAVMP